jgi:aldose 1-epimerase
MAFDVTVSDRTAGDRTGPVYEMTDAGGTVRAEIWPMWGFNCLRWQVRQADGSWGSIIYTAPDWETNPVPTRSGHPILFPFPGRLRDGRFTFDGKTWQLPLNDSTKQHAIHGFTPRNPWRVVGVGKHPDCAIIDGRFELGQELPSALGHWPVDFALTVTYRLYADHLTVEAHIENREAEAQPFGLGYHPYFRLPGVVDADVGGHVLQANVREVWETDAANLPTGKRAEVSPALDFRRPRPIGATALDHVFTGVTAGPVDGLTELAVLSHPRAPGRLRVLADSNFRELVLFTPPHRQAVAIEPYTCSADAASLQARGIDSGWRVLGPGENWKSRVEYRWEQG